GKSPRELRLRSWTTRPVRAFRDRRLTYRQRSDTATPLSDHHLSYPDHRRAPTQPSNAPLSARLLPERAESLVPERHRIRVPEFPRARESRLRRRPRHADAPPWYTRSRKRDGCAPRRRLHTASAHLDASGHLLCTRASPSPSATGGRPFPVRASARPASSAADRLAAESRRAR